MGGLVFLVVLGIALSRTRREGRSLPRTFGWVGKACILLSWVVVAGSPGGIPAFALLTPVVVAFVAPTFVLRRVVVPLGWPRLAYWTARLLSPSELFNDSGRGACFGALATGRRRSSRQPSMDWLGSRLDGARFLHGPGVVAAGLLAALRGDREGARCLFELADGLDAKVFRTGGRVIARDWLVAEAAHRGDWPRVTRLGRRGRQSLRWSYCLARIGEHLSGAPWRCHAVVLCVLWIAAPRRRATLPLLRRALRRPRAAPPASAPPGDLPAALAQVAQRLAHGFAQDPGCLAEAMNALDAALDSPETLARVERRRLAVGAQQSADAILASTRARLSDLVAPCIEDAPALACAERPGAILEGAVAQVRARWFKDIDALCADYRRRAEAGAALGTLAEWETWARLRGRAGRLLEADPAARFALFQSMYLAVNNFAVFQQNTCKRVILAFDMYSWLRRHAHHDEAACRLLDQNIKSCRL